MALTNQHFSQQTKGTTHSGKRVSERKGVIGLRSANITGKRKELCVSTVQVKRGEKMPALFGSELPHVLEPGAMGTEEEEAKVSRTDRELFPEVV